MPDAERLSVEDGDSRMMTDDPVELDWPISDHAQQRMLQRRISPEAVAAVMRYGREIPTRGGFVYAIGRKEVERFSEDQQADLTDFSGVQVVCSVQGVILTVYRNHNFRQLRVGLGRGRYNRVKPRRAQNRISFPS